MLAAADATAAAAESPLLECCSDVGVERPQVGNWGSAGVAHQGHSCQDARQPCGVQGRVLYISKVQFVMPWFYSPEYICVHHSSLGIHCEAAMIGFQEI